MENVNKRNETPVMKCFYRVQFRLWTFPYPVGHDDQCRIPLILLGLTFSAIPFWLKHHSIWIILISHQILWWPDWTLDALYVDRSPAADPVDSKHSLPSRVGKSDGLGQGTLPGTFDYWHVFCSLASPLLKKNLKKNESQLAKQISTRKGGYTGLSELWQVGLCLVRHAGNSKH